VLRSARGSLEIQDAKIAILAPSHNFVELFLSCFFLLLFMAALWNMTGHYIFAP